MLFYLFIFWLFVFWSLTVLFLNDPTDDINIFFAVFPLKDIAAPQSKEVSFLFCVCWWLMLMTFECHKPNVWVDQQRNPVSEMQMRSKLGVCMIA